MSQTSIYSLPLPCLCASHQPARQHLPLQSFFSDGVVFQNPSLHRTLWLGPTLTLWGRVLLTSGWVLACPRKLSHNSAAVEVQRLWQITTHSWCQVSLHSGLFVPITAKVAVLWGLLGPLPVGRMYDLYKMLSKQGTPSPLVAHGPLRHCCLLLGICSTSSSEHH